MEDEPSANLHMPIFKGGMKMIMNSKLYDCLKWVAQILLPALASLYFGLAQIWSLPLAEEIVGTITVVDTFLGVILGISKANYDKKIIDLRDKTIEEIEE